MNPAAVIEHAEPWRPGATPGIRLLRAWSVGWSGLVRIEGAWSVGCSGIVRIESLDVVRVSSAVAADALAVLRERDVPRGPVLANLRRRCVEVIVPAGTAAAWPELRYTRCLDNAVMRCPAPSVTSSSGLRPVDGRLWLTPPAPAAPVTTSADELAEAVTVAISRYTARLTESHPPTPVVSVSGPDREVPQP